MYFIRKLLVNLLNAISVNRNMFFLVDRNTKTAILFFYNTAGKRRSLCLWGRQSI